MGEGKQRKWKQKHKGERDWRLGAFRYGLLLFASVIAIRLFTLQVVNHSFYQAVASGQHQIFKELFPSRGNIYIQDLKDGSLVSVATNRQLAFVYADPRHIKDLDKVVDTLVDIFKIETDEEKDDLRNRLADDKDPYEPIKRGVEDEVLDKVIAADLDGIYFVREDSRFYPEPKLGGHFRGFLGTEDDGSHAGKYGIEGFYEKELAGTPGFFRSERDTAGRLITVGDNSIEPAVDGADIVLTLDRNIQFQACEALKRAVDRHSADGGSVLVMEAHTGEILAMCGVPDFDPNYYNQVEDINVFNNPTIFNAYEPGSVFKTFTMAAALDTGAVTPSSTYTDPGEVKIDVYTIKNSDEKAHGVQTMTEVLEKSLNTGVIYAMRETGKDVFAEYIKNFGFGDYVGLDIETELPGTIEPIFKKHEIYAATASYGQGLAVTPIQLAAAYGAIASGGILKRPYIVSEVRYSDGTVDKRSPEEIRRVIESKTATLLGAMLIAVVEHGHAGEAGVDGYYLAGKTGTAQVPRTDGVGYRTDATIATFSGFGPIEDPKFVIITRIDTPRDTPWAASTAAPLFAEISEFLLKYFEIPPTRAVEP